MHSHEILGRERLILSVVREEKAARESGRARRGCFIRAGGTYRRKLAFGRVDPGDE